MASGTFYPAVSGDDGYWYSSGFGSSASYIWLGNEGIAVHGFWRFPNATIPEGATITDAFIRLTSYNYRDGTTVNLDVFFNDVDNAVAPTSQGDANALALTAGVAWDAIGTWTGSVQYDSPSLTAILQTIIDRVGWSSGNALQVLIKDGTSSDNAVRYASAFDYSSGSQKAELHITWDEPILGEITGNAGIADTYDAVVLADQITEGMGCSDSYEVDTPYRDITGNVGIASAFIGSGIFTDQVTNNAGISDNMVGFFEFLATITNNTGMSDDIVGFFEFLATITEDVGTDDAYARYIEAFCSIQDSTGTADDYVATRLCFKTIQDILSSWDTLKWGWNKTIADSLAIADTASKILGIPVKEWLSIIDSETTNWNGVENISDSFYTIDMSKAVKVYEDLIADGIAIVDAVKLVLRLIITDILTCTGTVLNVGTFQHSIEDGMTLEDIARRLFPKSVSDSFVASDTSLVDFLTLLQISDSFNTVDTATRLVSINQIIADSLAVLDTVTVQQLIQELIQEGLNFDVSIVIDGEVWETWVLNTSAFHPSVYSNYEFNSFAIDKSNNICYGCKSDGIYTLEGDTDNGATIRAGIILPDTQFDSANNKRFRKAWLAVEGDNLILKAETESGNKTYRMVDTEVSITRDLKGRSWKFSVEGFNSLDSIDLVPIILSRK